MRPISSEDVEGNLKGDKRIPSLFYRKEGSGPLTLVFLHGEYSNSIVWSDLHSLEGYTTLTVDLRGFGNSKKTGKLSIENHRDDLRALLLDLRALLLDLQVQKFVLIGWSMGGLIAQAYALEYPEGLQKLVLINSTPQFIRESSFPWGPTRQEKLEFTSQLISDFREETQKISLKAIPEHREVRHKFKRLLREIGQDIILRQGLDILSFSSLNRIHQLGIPTLILVGAKDRIIPPNCSFLLRQLIPNSTLLEYPEAGHALFLTFFEDFKDDLLDFLQEGRDIPTPSEVFLSGPLIEKRIPPVFVQPREEDSLDEFWKY